MSGKPKSPGADSHTSGVNMSVIDMRSTALMSRGPNAGAVLQVGDDEGSDSDNEMLLSEYKRRSAYADSWFRYDIYACMQIDSRASVPVTCKGPLPRSLGTPPRDGRNVRCVYRPNYFELCALSSTLLQSCLRRAPR